MKCLEAHIDLIQFANATAHSRIALVRAYWGNGQTQAARNLANHLAKPIAHPKANSRSSSRANPRSSSKANQPSQTLTPAGDLGSQRWARQFLAASQSHPKARDPLAAERAARSRTQAQRFHYDITGKLVITALHLSIYGGLLLAPLIPGSLWRDLAQVLWQVGQVTPELILPLAIALAPAVFPLALLRFAQEPEFKAQGREVVNYWITMLAIGFVTSTGGGLLLQAESWLAQLPLLGNLAKLLVAVAGLSYGVAPLGAIAWFWLQPERVFRYPFILRLI